MFKKKPKPEHVITAEPNGPHGLYQKCSCGWEHSSSDFASAKHAKTMHLTGNGTHPERDTPTEPA